jgi:hypothetical protein
MSLYLDLTKAVQIPSTGTDTVSGAHSAREYKESFSRTSSGVTGGDPSPDKPEVGKRWRDSDGEGSLDEELEADRKRDTEIAQERGIIAKKEDDSKQESTKKALDILKSFSGDLSAHLAAYTPNEREVEYLVDFRGYDAEDVAKGLVRITGRERAKFNDWLHSRLRTSIDRLLR